MNSKNIRTLENIFKKPVQANIAWADIGSLLVALGANISEGSASRIRIKIYNISTQGCVRLHCPSVYPTGTSWMTRMRGLEYDGV